MKTPSTRILAASLAGLLLLAACGGTTGSTWTIAPVQPTPTPGPSAIATVAPSVVPASPVASTVPGSPAASAATNQGAGQTIKLELTGSLSITQGGESVSSLTVKTGETVHFVIDNTAGFPHDFFIGPANALAQNQVDGLPGIPQWSSGVQEFDYTVTAETAGLEFACTVPGHYPMMHGTFTVQP